MVRKRYTLILNLAFRGVQQGNREHISSMPALPVADLPASMKMVSYPAMILRMSWPVSFYLGLCMLLLVIAQVTK